MSKSQLPRLRNKGKEFFKKVKTDGQTSFKFGDCLNAGNLDLLQRIAKAKNAQQVSALLTAFKDGGYNKVAFARN